MGIIFYAEPQTKNGQIGTIILSENVEDIVAECAIWLSDEKLSASSIKSPCPVVNRESGMELGRIHFTEEEIDYRSNY